MKTPKFCHAFSHQCLSAVIRFRTIRLRPLSPSSARGHQCLSAVIRFRTTLKPNAVCVNVNRSPMPFGSHPFQDRWPFADILRQSPLVTNAFRQSSVSGPGGCFGGLRLELEVTNAFRQSSVSGRGVGVIDPPVVCHGSPMPFGSHPFQDILKSWLPALLAAKSPMPFGSHPFQDE